MIKFSVLFVADSEEGVVIGLTWAAPEGEGEFILKEVDGKLEETDIKSGRYWSPL